MGTLTSEILKIIFRKEMVHQLIAKEIATLVVGKMDSKAVKGQYGIVLMDYYFMENGVMGHQYFMITEINKS